ncbi:MAG TPA: hypothetical protein VMT11_16345 [Myxococcaceae bacterium]|nr:hypothetical protein [Myxococcaceae bacterium]
MLAFWMVPALALGADTPARTPAEELEAELAQQVKIPEPELVVVTDGPDPARFELIEGAVELDGRPLPGPVEPGWGKEFYRGPVVPGNHVLTAQLGYRGSKTGAYPWSGSFTYRVPGKVEFQAQRGLRLVVHLRVEVREDHQDPRNRLAFRAALEPEMTAKVDDAPMPPPPPRRVRPEELFKPELAPPVASVPETPPPAPAKTKRKTPKKKSSVAATGPSLDVATARLQKEIATPSTTPAPKSSGKPPTAGGSTGTRSKGPPDAGPIQD